MGKVTVVSEQKMLVSRTHQEVCVAFVWIFISFAFQNFFNIFMYLFLAVLGLYCCTWTFSSCGEQGLLFVVMCSH